MTVQQCIPKFSGILALALFTLLPLFQYGQTIAQLKKELAVEKKPKKKARIHLDIGNEYYKEGNFVSALDEFFASLKISEKIGDEFNVATAFNNLAAVYVATEKYEQAESYAKKAIGIFKKLDEKLDLANSYTNLGNVYYMQMKDSLCLHYYKEAIRNRKMVNDSIGLFSTYKNLGSLYFEIGDTLNGIANIENSLSYLKPTDDSFEWFTAYVTLSEVYVYAGKLDKGKMYLDSCASFVENKNSSAYHLIDDYYYVLYEYHKGKGNFEQALVNYKLYDQFKDSVENLEKHQQISELGVKYETEKKEQRINLQDKLIREEQRSKNLILLISGVILVVLILVFFMYRTLHKSRIERMEKVHNEKILTEIINTEEKERSRIAKDLHDGIVQDLTALKFELNDIQDKAPKILHAPLSHLHEEIDKISHEVRELSYQMMPITLKELGLLKAVEELLNRNLSHNNIEFELNTLGFGEERLSEKIEVTVYRICQELINNTLKHSKASRISLLMQLREDMLQVTFEDDGIGFDAENVTKGVGLNSLNSRVAWINGSLEFDSSEITTGTTAFLRIPV